MSTDDRLKVLLSRVSGDLLTRTRQAIFLVNGTFEALQSPDALQIRAYLDYLRNLYEGLGKLGPDTARIQAGLAYFGKHPEELAEALPAFVTLQREAWGR